MNINEAMTIVEMMPQEFDSHKFICKYILECTRSYGHLLVKHGNVTTAHGEIGKFLLNNAHELGIEKNDKKNSSNILGNTDLCALWKKVK